MADDGTNAVIPTPGSPAEPAGERARRLQRWWDDLPQGLRNQALSVAQNSTSLSAELRRTLLDHGVQAGDRLPADVQHFVLQR